MLAIQKVIQEQVIQMLNRIVEIASDGIHASLNRGFLQLRRSKEIVGQVPLPDIGGLVIRGYGASISLNLVSRLSELKIPIVLCGTDQSPSAVVWPLAGHHAASELIEAQAQLSLPRKKRLWQSIVKAKIEAQARTLLWFGKDANDLLAMKERVQSGDPENLEAQAAKRYWKRLMEEIEPHFSRSRGEGFTNAALNYGYTVLRAGMARSILASGLHPGFSVHHKSSGDSLRLADDLMEPYRPLVDLVVYQISSDENEANLTPDHKQRLVKVLSMDLITSVGITPLQTSMDRLAQNYRSVCLGQSRTLTFAQGPSSSEWEAR
ncbi:MAG TPA: type II CRISPR-associated endonuclease Cas1 [Hyphomonadaceae bacterium]|nr:subtype II CRISPR-associated endonuclease Cas1 [Ponticaulis sp.]HBJ94700.1 type II CRISPR-associated endonuclease Cas1 [Hyphomonadaceae bacterium]